MVESLIRERDGVEPADLHLQRKVLSGGLEAASLHRVTARYIDAAGEERTFPVVVKRLVGVTTREADVYERFLAEYAADLAPALYAVTRLAADEAVLYMEALDPVRSWPWSDRRAAQSVLVTAAALHARRIDPEISAALDEWDYEAELEAAAALTLERMEELRRQPGLWSFGGALRATRRLVHALPALRRQLLAFEPFGTSIIHGDLHSGNVVLRDLADVARPVLIDWARARCGSPLEDVSSWLHSLGAWEPEAKRRHDSLFAGYLAARGMEPRIRSDVRAAYWLASASNALAGALSYYISVMLDPHVPSEGRASAANLAREWMRVLKRADGFWS
jgi:hypothetical protein